MSEPIIRVEGLGKKYRIHHEKEASYTTFRDTIARKMKLLFQPSAFTPQLSQDEDFWALNDINFEIQQGEVVGIIGRNGAGKSTLLKILSRITEPTTGRITLNGRVASLLEVGTGFHPELTGRENIFLNGAILGMRKEEIKSKFDEIVAFAEVEQFLDTPVKRYSSGMYVRLAFSVAAHLEPEILVVDEVLAVGDTQFQKKCLGRMRDVASSGRTVLFVSHNMNALEGLCTKAILLKNGFNEFESTDVRSVINRHLNRSPGTDRECSSWENVMGELDHPVMQPLFFAVVDKNGLPLQNPVRNDEPLRIIIRANIKQSDPALNAGIALYDQESNLLMWSLTTDGPETLWPSLELGIAEFSCTLPTRFLNEGSYRMELNVSLHCRDWILQPGRNSPSINFEIQGGLSDSPYWTFARPGIMAPELKWVRVK